ncbi:hypothetical protein [Spirosoma rhododendri]|uniref:Tc toxin complex TcA C-terminal TcB-binding domain-containing protein n=1 Tax=Spirosoma rhododendri TaxID=2728024 RepID=A0A7L5DZX6_9BACT|nr:hypothetical protein [Spirosoma rhododendri]QJD81527.1 hypothetical protein HH216_24460 [Spirosoma rhododendri]
MYDLKATIANYNPTVEKLKSKFRYWHIEALLNQAADLVEKCIQELKEYNALNYAFNQLLIEIEVEEKALELDRVRLEDGYFNREERLADMKLTFFDKSIKDFDMSLAEAQKLHNYQTNEGQGAAGWTRAGQNLNEKEIEYYSRVVEEDLIMLQRKWARHEVDYNIQSFRDRYDALEKKKSFVAEGMPFAIDRQRDEVAKRVSRNYVDALDRSKVTEQGLEIIYGYNEKIPTDNFDNKPTDQLVTSLAIWIRNAIEFIVAYQQREQGFTRVVSVRSLLSNQEWIDLEKHDVLLRIPTYYFENHDNVRIRGIGASIVGNAGKIPWTIKIKVPNSALYTRELNEIRVDQSDLPMCLLGRVENRSSPNPIEICGMTSLINSSPIGIDPMEHVDNKSKWLIKINDSANHNEKFSDIDDILLELILVGIPKN